MTAGRRRAEPSSTTVPLSLTPAGWAHLFRALNDYVDERQHHGELVPESLVKLRLVAAQHGTRRQDTTNVADSLRPTETRPHDENALLTKAEAARHLRCDVRTIERRIKDGQLAVVRVGRLVRIPFSALTALEQRPLVTPPEPPC